MSDMSELYLVSGVLATLLIVISAMTILLGKKDYWLVLISALLGSAFCYSAVTEGFNHDVNNALILSSAITALFATPFVWREMLVKPFDHPGQWSLQLVILAVLFANQFLLKSSLFLLVPTVLVCLAVILESNARFRRLSNQHQELENELDAKRVAVGLDLATGLPNKLAFTERVEKWLFIHPNEKINIVVFKFTRFDELNALIGHNNADLVKIQLITRLKASLTKNQSLLNLSDGFELAPFATVGGVDFAAAIRAEKNNFATESFIGLLKETIKEPIVVDSTAVDVGIEFGVASYPSQAQSAENLIENAYVAMNLAQTSDTSVYFDQKQQSDIATNRTIISQLKEDVKQKRFVLYVQPQVALNNKQVVGGEVLIRWDRQNKGIVTAEEFIKLAEQSGIIYQLNLWSIEMAIKTLSDFKGNDLPQTLSVNVSNRELFQSQLVETVLGLLEKYMVEPEKLVIEVKESAFAINQYKALKVARLFQQAGVKVAIDDFGKDRTAIGTFNNFTPYYLKVDCRHLSAGKPGEQINTYINAIIGMAKTLKFPVIAQGIETETTETQLADLGCDVGQGFLYSKPFELEGFVVWLEQWKRSLNQLDS